MGSEGRGGRFNTFAQSLIIHAARSQVWQQLIDWESQSDWMAMTRVTAERSGRLSSESEIGVRIRAFTGVSKIGVMDEMVVTAWEPEEFCAVVHVGKIIKGIGEFRLAVIDDSTTRFDWYEEIEGPAWLLWLLRPGIVLGVRFSLARFARICRDH